MAFPRMHVEPPSFSPLPFGLLATFATDIRTPADPHWQYGVNYEVVCPLGGTTYDECLTVSGSGSAAPAAPPVKSENAELDVRGATPFTVYAELDCSVPGFWDRAQQLAEQALTQTEQFQVERALWTGVAGGASVVYPHLAANAQVADETGILLQTAATTVVSGSGPLDIVEGVGRIEGALAECYRGVGVLHVPRTLVSDMAANNLLVREGPRYRTPGGNVVVFGSGYTGSSPSGASSDGADWVYATGMPFIYRGEVTVTSARDSVNRETNLARVIAERTYVIGWDCCHLAVNISLGGVVTGTPGS